MIKVCSSHVESVESILAIPFDRFPHNKIIGSKVLERFIRGPIFVDCFMSPMETDGTGDWGIFV